MRGLGAAGRQAHPLTAAAAAAGWLAQGSCSRCCWRRSAGAPRRGHAPATGSKRCWRPCGVAGAARAAGLRQGAPSRTARRAKARAGRVVPQGAARARPRPTRSTRRRPTSPTRAPLRAGAAATTSAACLARGSRRQASRGRGSPLLRGWPARTKGTKRATAAALPSTTSAIARPAPRARSATKSRARTILVPPGRVGAARAGSSRASTCLPARQATTAALARVVSRPT